ncbi:MAG TPA: response regulator transcription factor [Candidatus Acidoferrales bacterium]|nr:response regulator transcription factor [Candidatus Acidoferrales bacterium]
MLNGPSFSPEVKSEIVASGVHVLLLDSMPLFLAEGDALQVLRSETPELKIVLMGMEDDDQAFLQSVRRGAIGFLLKEASAAEVVAAVRAVTSGEAVCPPRLCRVLFEYLSQQTHSLPSSRTHSQLGLTRREQQLVPLIVRGLSNKEIAARLNVSEQTVKNHVHRILHKVGADNRLGVVDVCRERGMIL